MSGSNIPIHKSFFPTSDINVGVYERTYLVSQCPIPFRWSTMHEEPQKSDIQEDVALRVQWAEEVMRQTGS